MSSRRESFTSTQFIDQLTFRVDRLVTDDIQPGASGCNPPVHDTPQATSQACSSVGCGVAAQRLLDFGRKWRGLGESHCGAPRVTDRVSAGE